MADQGDFLVTIVLANFPHGSWGVVHAILDPVHLPVLRVLDRQSCVLLRDFGARVVDKPDVEAETAQLISLRPFVVQTKSACKLGSVTTHTMDVEDGWTSDLPITVCVASQMEESQDVAIIRCDLNRLPLDVMLSELLRERRIHFFLSIRLGMSDSGESAQNKRFNHI